MIRLAVACLCALTALAAGGPGAAEARSTFTIAADEPDVIKPERSGDLFPRLDDLAIRRMRINLNWSSVAPATTSSSFDPRDPADPLYHWAKYDAVVRAAAAAGKSLIVTVGGAPKWAQGTGERPAGVYAIGGFHVSAEAYGDFARAATERYSGSFPDPLLPGAKLPRVRFWQSWNEPNLDIFFYPARPSHYLPLLNALYREAKAVHRDNYVIGAGLAPVLATSSSDFPLRFASEMLCVRHRGKFRQMRFRAGGCRRPRARFDAIAIHPYSLGAAPGQSAAIDGNVFVANVPTLAKMLKVAARAGLTETRDPRLWVTEFSRFTNPPNASIYGETPYRAGLSAAESIYRLWRAGVSTFTWHLVFERDPSTFLIPGGALLAGDGKEKPTYRAVRFPLYAGNDRRGTLIWGKAPLPNRMVGFGGRIPAIVAGPDGVFYKRLRRRLGGRLVARQDGVKSLVTPIVR